MNDEDEILRLLTSGPTSYADGGSVDEDDDDDTEQDEAQQLQADKDDEEEDNAYLENRSPNFSGLSDEEMGVVPTNARPIQHQGDEGLTDEQMGLSDADMGVGGDDEELRQPTDSLSTIQRAALKSAPSAAGGIVAGSAMANAGGAIGLGLAGPIGGLAGYFGGMALGAFSGGYIMDKVADWLEQQAGMKDPGGYFDERQMQAEREERPISTAVGELAPAVAAFKFDKAATLSARLAGALLQGGMAGGQQIAQGEFDPVQLGLNTAAGAVFTKPRAITGAAINRVERAFPNPFGKEPTAGGTAGGEAGPGANAEDVSGRPNFPQTEARAAEQKNVDQNDVTTTAPGVAADNPPVSKTTDVGGNLAPVRSDRRYPKTASNDNTQSNIGVMKEGPADDVRAALEKKSNKSLSDDEMRQPLSEADYGDAAIAAERNRPAPKETENGAPPAAADEAAIPPNARPTEHVTVKGDEPPPGPTYPHPELPGVTVDRSNMVARDAALSPDGKTLAVDSRLPPLLDVAGKKLDPAIPLGVREAVYKQVYDGPGATKALAKEAALHAEDQWLQSRGYDPKAYRSAVRQVTNPVQPKGTAAIKAVEPHLQRFPKVRQWFDAQPDKGLAARQILEAMTNVKGKTKETGYADARVPSKPPTVEGVAKQARTKGEAEARGAVVKAANEAFEKFKPKEGEPVPTSKAQKDALRARLQMAAEHVARAGTYRPRDLTAAPSLKWVLAAKKLLNGRMSQKQIAKFIADEKLLRSGNPEDVKTVVNEGSIEGNLATRSKRPTVEAAEESAAAEGRDIDWQNLSDQDIEDLHKAQTVADEGLAKKVEKAKPQWEIDAENRKAKMAAQKAAREGKVSDKKVTATVKKFLTDEQGGAAIPEAAKRFLSNAKEFLTRPPSEDWRASTARTPEEKYARSIDDRLYQVDKRLVGHYRTLAQRAKNWPKEFANDKVMNKIYRAKETKNLSFLTPGEKTFMSTELEPLWDANKQIMQAIAKIDPTFEFDPNSSHVHRIADMPDVNQSLAKEYKVSANPVGSTESVDRSLNTITSALKERAFMALKDKNGNMKIVSPTEDGNFHIWTRGKSSLVKNPETPAGKDFDFKKGSQYKDKQGNVWTLDDALTPDIERHGRFRNGQMAKYIQNAGLSAIKANADLTTVLEHMKLMNDLTNNDPTFQKLTSRSLNEAMDQGWPKEPSKLYPFDKLYMHPALKNVFDHYAQPGFEGDVVAKWRDLSRGVTKLMFWMPTAHAMNVGNHWFVARGWDWMNPVGYARLAATTARAIHSVVTQDSFQNVLRDNGAGTVYGGVLNENWLRQIARAAGEDMTERNPTKWDPIVKELGLTSVRDLAHATYDASARIMWAVNDVFLTQHIMEKMEKGHSLQDAIVKAERHIPNYRIPVEVMGSKLMGKFLGDPGTSAFGRYRYGVFNSYAHIMKSLVNGTPKQRMEAAGNIMALGLLAFAVKPILDKAVQYVTGNEDAEVRARGPLTLPYHFIQALKGAEDPYDALKEINSFSPLLNTMTDYMRGRDYAGRKIIEPSDVRDIFDPDSTLAERGKAAARVTLQGGEHFLRNTVSPYGTLANSYGADRSVLETIRNQALDIKEPSEKSLVWQQKQPKRDRSQARHRAQEGRGRGPAEELFNKFDQ